MATETTDDQAEGAAGELLTITAAIRGYDVDSGTIRFWLDTGKLHRDYDDRQRVVFSRQRLVELIAERDARRKGKA